MTKYPERNDFIQRGTSFIEEFQQMANTTEISRDFGSNNAAVVVVIVCSILNISCLAIFIFRKKKLENR